MKRKLNKVGGGQSFDAAPSTKPLTVDKPTKPRLSQLPGAIPIKETARIAAALNRDAFLNVMAQVIFTKDTINPPLNKIA